MKLVILKPDFTKRLHKALENTMIDWQRVHELQDEVGLEDFHEVVDLFLEEVEEVVERLKGTPDPASYEADFHFLKGSALNLGFQAFATICADNERSAAAGKPDYPWSVCCFGRTEHVAIERAFQLGGHGRIGFENNRWLPGGEMASSNAELVRATLDPLDKTRRTIAGVDWVRENLVNRD